MLLKIGRFLRELGIRIISDPHQGIAGPDQAILDIFEACSMSGPEHRIPGLDHQVWV